MNCLNKTLVVAGERVGVGIGAEARARTEAGPGIELQGGARPGEGEILPRGRFPQKK